MVSGELNGGNDRPLPPCRAIATQRLDDLVGRAIVSRSHPSIKVFRCTLHAGERLCAEAVGLFISIKPGTFERLVVDRERREGGGDDAP